ncbi:hypothetical protein B0H13DRAFT_1448988, partial [Mycena leptocephala]
EHRGCLSKTGICKARFHREAFETTHDNRDGQAEYLSQVLTYFSRSNTAVTSLFSGTTVKVVVSDYVSKLGLK